MPAAIQYVPPSDIHRSGVLGLLLDSDLQRRATWFDTVWKYYHGEHSAQLDIKDDEPDDNTTLNLVREVVDRTVAFLFSTIPRFELDAAASEETPNEAWLRGFWEANDGLALLHDFAYNGAMMGDTYVRVLPPDNEEHPYPIILPINPKAIQTYWEAGNIRKVLWHELNWTIEDLTVATDYILDVVKREGGWTLYYYKSTQGAAQFTEYKREEWNLQLPPVIHSKHLPNPQSYYGMGEFTPAQIDLNDKVNLIASEINRIIRYHASPKTVATGVEPGEIQTTAIDQLFSVPSDKAEIYNLEMKSDLSASSAHFERLRQVFLSESRVIMLAGAVKDFQRVTNAGVRTVFIDQLLKTAVLVWNYGKLLAQVSRVAAALGGLGSDVIPKVVFADPLPVDATEVVNVAMLERQMQVVSRQSIAVQRGYNWDDELKKQQAEAELDVFAEEAKPSAGGGAGLQNEPGSTTNK